MTNGFAHMLSLPRGLVLLIGGLCLGCAAAQTFTTPETVLTKPEVRTTPDDVYLVNLETSKGRVVLEIHPEWAPIGADRFRELVDAEFFDDCRFFRAVPGFVVQCGMSGDPLVNSKWKEKKLPDDPVLQTNKRGYVTFATSGTDSRTTQFFINLKHNAALDKMGFAPIGRVIEGMELVDQIETKYAEEPDQQLISTRGNAYLRSNFPDLDYIQTARTKAGGGASGTVTASGERTESRSAKR
ncbi:Peptidyl-prolyl cis-trans isomerase A precursor [Planctomyces sp. SH-PL14]|nr:Peptidyl-prolyl cis-trans isomerase A precursor [Planctomyces sp. SH-PL14]